MQCFCGNEYPSDDDKRPESECNSKCAGELTAICGAQWRNTIYSTASSTYIYVNFCNEEIIIFTSTVNIPCQQIHSINQKIFYCE